MSNQELAQQNNTALSNEVLDQFAGISGAGFEGADEDTYAIPFMRVLQSGSPQCKRSAGEYIQGAQEGMILNSVTNELWDGDDGIEIVPCAFARVYTHWRPMDSGGGFLGEVPVDDPRVNQGTRDGGSLVLPDNTVLQDTRKHYVLVLREDGGWDPVLINMSSTQIKKSRQLMTRLRNLKLRNSSGKLFTPPMFANVVRLRTAGESNDQGSWFGWQVDFSTLRQLNPSDPAERETFQAAKDFADAVRAGQVEETAPEEPAGGATPEEPDSDDEPAF